ncbi:hypothetical protein PSQ90_03665 [Devosia rhodophyticola]|uniref:Glycosyl transferase family 28 C-terminal domain-containing protein n=1 Tax=Devosia rhodophyticola TaxID=3026423 RepID=A0ABY7YZB5_9HYPH|nr:hypothetical protein [Devosia rhodophyticola]WDR06572.1 hypothetical protein PSQ90_03665 [Devosia rhodophyticola]
MTDKADQRCFLVISNGHGEDWIAAALIKALPDNIRAEAYPMIGAGNAYAHVCPIVGPRAALASEGWRNVKGSLRKDIATGGLSVIPPALRFLRQIRGRYDRVIVVGDMVGVLGCVLTGVGDLTYLDVYKTGAARLYSPLEAMAIRRSCKAVFCRAANLAAILKDKGVDARCVGNIMMDTVPSGDYDAGARRSRPHAVTLLPGSRALTAESFAVQINALRTLSANERPDIFLALAGSVKVDDLARSAKLQRTPMLTGEASDVGELSDGDLTVHMARGGAMGNLLATSDIVLSQAGTATVQALGLGKPAITFVNARDRRSRFRDEQELFGSARIVTEADPASVGQALGGLLRNSQERARLGDIGRQRIGGPGAMAAIIEELSGS